LIHIYPYIIFGDLRREVTVRFVDDVNIGGIVDTYR
jgi:hypothetical protein